MAAAAAVAARSAPQAAGPPSFGLYFLGHSIGHEIDLTSDDFPSFEYTFHFDDRGAAVDLRAELRLGSDGAARRFKASGKNYRYFSVDSEVTVDGTTATVREGTETRTTSTGGRPFFPLDGYAPVGVHENLIRYWIRAGRPATILTEPAGPISIHRLGTTSFPLLKNGKLVRVERLGLDGVVWGREGAWVVAEGIYAGRLLALTTWAGALPFAAVAPEWQNDSSTLVTDLARSIQLQGFVDRITELERLTRSLKPDRSGTFALAGATVITGAEAAPIQNATIVVRDGRITAVGPASSIVVPRGVPTVDVKGRFIVPGLWDMHAHASQVDWAPVYLASGVTTIRDMGGEFEFLRRFRDAVASGRAMGPRMLLAGLVDGPGDRAFGTMTAATADEGRQIVRRYHEAKFEEIKIYSLVAPDVVRAICDEAHRLGMLVTGHVPNGMSVRDAVNAGFDQIAHMPINGQPGSPVVTELIQFFRDHQTAIDPTQSWNELLNRSAAAPISSFQPDVVRLPRPLRRMILSVPGGAADPAAAQTRLLNSLRLLRQAQQAGVAVVAGTDKGVPGFSVQREIELYVQGGMTPLEAIQAATIVPARVMRLEKDTGSIEAGKRADLLILTADPLARIENIRTGAAVVANGRMYSTDALWRAAGYRTPKN